MIPAALALRGVRDELHETLSGPATKKIFEREFTVFGNAAFKRLALISVSHLYTLRNSTRYKKKRLYFAKTKSRSLPIGQRRKPTPEGKPGYLRIDSVHQGDLDGKKGVYHMIPAALALRGVRDQHRGRDHAVSGRGVRGENQ